MFKWKHKPHVLAVCRQHAKDLLTALTQGGDVEKELADFCVIAELVGVSAELIEQRRRKFAETLNEPALSDYTPPLKSIEGIDVLPAVQLGLEYGYTQVELAVMLDKSVTTVNRYERMLKSIN